MCVCGGGRGGGGGVSHTHVKDPVVYVRVQWIMETLE